VREGGLRRILCIDDDVDMLHFMRDMFRGERVDCASLSGVAFDTRASRCCPSRSRSKR